jgi:alpha-L-fucosidase
VRADQEQFGIRPAMTASVMIMIPRFRCLVGIALAVVLLDPAATAQAQDRAAWMREARWGVMTHYLADWVARGNEAQLEMTPEEWDKLIDRFNVEGLSKQLESAGAGYHILTIGQNSGFYLSPNATYDRLVGVVPSKCSRRDLVAELSEALQRRGIRLIVYLPSGAPARDRAAIEALGWQDGEHKNRDFQLKWEQVIREWSERWGKKVDGWWFDGCYWPNTMYRTTEPPNFATFAAAARAGNPSSVVAFNPGVVDRSLSMTPFEDYIAGEINQPDRLMIRRAVNGKVDGVQIHVLSYLGETWGKGLPRFSDEQVIAWSRKILGSGGAATWDTPIQSDGLISEPFIAQLTGLGRALQRK